MNIRQYWDAVLNQNAEAMRAYFTQDAWVNWHNTNEHFSAEEFIRANCEYPGAWAGEIEQVIQTEEYIITAVHVYSQNKQNSFHVTSFIRLKESKILSIDEYWGDDGDPPEWRRALNIGRSIK